ncbi:MAG: hypothetical protein AB1742_11205 [bacterium]
MKRFLTLAAAILILGSAAHAGFPYREQFDRLLDYLLQNHWDESGNWSGDMMGDASWFAPALLFQLGRDEQKPEYVRMATKTVEWEASLFRAGSKNLQNIKISDEEVSVIGGMPGIFYGFKHTGRGEWKTLTEQVLILICSLAKANPETLVENFGGDVVVFLSAVSFASYLYHEETGGAQYRRCALEAVEIAGEKHWNEAEKHYGRLWDWSASAILLALSGAYRLSGDEKYRARADEVLDTVLDRLWDSENGGLISSHFDLKRAKVLSGNNLFAMAVLEWFKAAGDKKHLDLALKTFDFIFSPALYDGTYPHHHWTAEEGTAEEFCTGCHFHTLFTLYELKKALETGND